MTNRSFSRQPEKASVFRHAYAVLRWIIEPPASVEEKQRRRLRLLSTFLLLITITTLIGAITLKNVGNNSWPIMIATAAVLAAGYIFSRSGYYRLATVFAVVVPAFPIISMAFFSANKANIPNQLSWLALPLLISSILLSLRYTTIIAIIYVALIIPLIPLADVPVANLSQSLAFLFMIFFFVVAVTAVRQHDQSEIEHQLSERQQAEKALRESEEDYRRLFKVLPVGVTILDLKGVILYCNSAVYAKGGYAEDEFTGKHFSKISSVRIKDLPKYVRIFNSLLRGKTPEPFEATYQRKDGTTGWTELNIEMIKMGGKRRILVIQHDITERKRMDAALRESEEKFFKTFRSSPSSMSITTVKDGVFLEVNDSFLHDNGYTREEVIDRSAKELNIWARSGERESLIKKLRSKGRVVNEEYTSRKKSGELHTILFSAELINVAGEQCVLAVTTDITERKNTEEALKEREKRFSDIAENTAEWIWEVDTEGKYIYSSPVVETILGYKPEELLEKHFYDFFLPVEKEELKEAALQVFAQKKPFKEFINKNIRKDGKIVDLMTSGVPLIDDDGNLHGYRGVDTDITERRRMEEALRESEEKFSIAFRSSPNTMAITTAEDGRFIEINDSHTRITGYTREETIGHTSSELGLWVHAEDRVRMLKILKEQGRVSNEEFEFHMKNGEIRNWLFSAEKIVIGGEPCIISITVDITGRKRAEKLQQDENHVLTLLGQGAELSELLDAIVRLGESYNPAIKGSVLLYDSSKELLIPAATPNLPAGYRKFMENGIPIGPKEGICGTAAYSKKRVIVPDIKNTTLLPKEVAEQAISLGLFACWSQPILSSAGELLGTIASYSNKTGEPLATDLRVLEWSAHISSLAIERKAAEEALANEAIRRRILIEQSRDGIVVLYEDGRVYEVNQKFADMLGYSLEETRRLKVWDWEFLYPPEQVRDMLQSVDESGDHFETQHQRKDGSIYDVEISTNGAIFGGEKLIFCVCRDITERKRAEEKLKQALADLERSNAQLATTNKELETFSYSVSHDLRSPLRSIDGFSQALLEDYGDKLNENGQDYLKRLRGASQKMGELIDGLLKLSRLTRSEMHPEPVDLSALAEEITSRLQETHQGRRAKITIDKGLSTNGDPQLLRVLLENLLGNAWKFTVKKPLAKIEFGAIQNNGKKTYFVKDNGVGFDMTYADKLFGAFQRLHDHTEFPGTGIGLATVQRIINRHGGTIRAEGVVDKGATIYFTLA